MNVQNIYSPLYTNNILDTSPMKALREAEATEGTLEQLNSMRDLTQTPTPYLESDRGAVSRSVMSYDMYGGLQDDGFNHSGTRIDTYA